MNTRSRVLAAVAAATVSAIVMLTFSGPAQAATWTPAPRPAPDGNTYVYGLPKAQFPTVKPSVPPLTGGWMNDDWHKRSWGYFVNNTGNPFRPLTYQLLEPYVDSSQGLQVPVLVKAPQDNQNGGNLYASGMNIGPGTLNGLQTKVYCQQSEWAVAGAPSSTSYAVLGSYGVQASNPNGGAYSGVGNATMINSSQLASCPYIRQIDILMTWWTGGDTHDGNGQTKIETWYAQNSAVDKRVYTPYDGLKDICALSGSTVTNPMSPGCTDIYAAQGRVDGEDFATVCANPPATWVWGDFSWLGAFVGFYGKCLWFPVNGMDRDHAVANAWQAGPLGQIVAPITAAVTGLNLPDNCGPIFDMSGAGGPINMSAFKMDSCNWQPWATQLHDALALILPAWFGWWALGFVIAAISGVINRKVPTPVEMGREVL